MPTRPIGCPGAPLVPLAHEARPRRRRSRAAERRTGRCMRSVVPSTLIAHSSLTNGSLHLRRQVLRRLYDVINVLEAIHLLDRCLTIKRGVLWRGPPLTEVSLPPGCPRVEPQRFKDLLRKQPIRKRAAAELLAVSGLSALDEFP